MEDGHCLIAAQIGTDIVRKESEDFSLTLVLGTKARWVHWYSQTKWIRCYWLILHVLIFDLVDNVTRLIYF